jgi:hypothetical protein
MITHGSNANIADRCLKLDKWMGFVVLIGWASLAAGTEVRVMTDSAFVTVSLDVGLTSIARIAERSIAIDSMMTGLAGIGLG